MVTENTPGKDLLEEGGFLNPAPAYYLFSLNQIVLGTLFGGPVGAVFMLTYNLKKLEESAKIIWVFGVFLGLLFLVYLPDLMGYDPGIPNVVYTIIFCATAYYMGKYLVGAALDAHEKNGGSFASRGRVVITIILSLLAFILILAALLIISDPEGFKSLFNE